MQFNLQRCVSVDNSETGRSLMAKSNHRVYRKELNSDWCIEGQSLPALAKGSFVAMKLFSGDKNKAKMIDLCKKEFKLLKSCDHDNVVTVLALSSEIDVKNPESWPVYFMELGECSLEYVLQTKESDGSTFLYPTGDHCYSWPRCLSWLRQIASAIDYLHGLKEPIVHRDIKSSNVLLFDDKTRCKICDFDMSRYYSSEGMTVNVGTWRWMAPEMRSSTDNKQCYNLKVDSYSFGVLICEAIFRERPFDCYEQDCLLKNFNEIPSTLEATNFAMSIIRESEEKSVQLTRECSVFQLSDKLWQMINNLLSWDPQTRPDFRHVVSLLAVEKPKVSIVQAMREPDSDEHITDTGLRTNQTCPSIPRVWQSIRLHYTVKHALTDEAPTPEEQMRIVELLSANSGGVLSFYEEEADSNQQADANADQVTSQFSFTSGNTLEHEISGSDHITRESVARVCKTSASLLDWMSALFQRETKYRQLRSVQFRLMEN